MWFELIDVVWKTKGVVTGIEESVFPVHISKYSSPEHSMISRYVAL